MVKNFGGNKAKSSARKNLKPFVSSHVREPQSPLEVFAYVTKIFGGSICQVYTQTNLTLIAHIRRKFSGRGKRNSIIAPNTFVLIGLREWESTPTNCDILEVYTPIEVDSLSSTHSIHFLPTTTTHTTHSDEFSFSHINNTTTTISDSIIETFDSSTTTIDIDDI